MIMLARALMLGAALGAFGLALFPLYAGDDAARGRRALLRAAACAAFALSLVVVGADAMRFLPTVPPLTLAQTGFGRAWIAQALAAGALCFAAFIDRPRRPTPSPMVASRTTLLTLALAAAPLIAIACVSHGAAAAGAFGAGVLALHLMSAGAWAGGLAALVMRLSVAPEAALVRRFSHAAYVFVALACVTGLANLAIATGAPWPALAAPYGKFAALKLVLFALACALAAFNHWRAAPRQAWALLRRAIYGELALMAALIAAAAALASQPPR
jgi:putative copper export protein